MKAEGGDRPGDAEQVKRVAYLVSRFPKLTETFILYEILELERRGVRVELFPLIREREPVAHPEARELVERAHYSRPWEPEVLAAQLYWLLRRPLAYLGCWLRAVAGNAGSPGFLLRALAVVPQAAWFARRMGELGVEHIHAHWATHPTLAAYVAGRLAGLPYSFTAHAHDIYVRRPMLAAKLRAASFAVTISQYNRDLLHDLYGDLADKVALIRCGADLALFRPRPPRPANGPLTILCVASLQDYKGHRYLLDACALLRDAGLPFRCLLAGDGEERAALEQQVARLRLGSRVTLLGRQTREQVVALMAEADLMVLPSVTTPSGKREGVPVALMEALACELPVVATAVSGIPELVVDGETGLLVAERDVAELVTAVLVLAADAALARRLGAAGRRHVLELFDLASNAGALAALLRHDWSAEAVPAPEAPLPAPRAREVGR
jgi:colanic acid/amylovoran biosynthesis glycosyltransferase